MQLDHEQIQSLVDNMAMASFNPDGTLKYYLRAETLACGSYRWVFDGLGIVLKMSCCPDANRREWDLFQRASMELKPLLAQCHAISKCGRVLAMEKVNTTARNAHMNEDSDPMVGFNGMLKKVLERMHFSSSEVYDLLLDNHPSNIGIRKDGTMAWIDYASV